MKVVFSGVRPSGVIHLGNYLGAIKNWVELQKNYRCIFCVVDYHAITTPFDPKELSQNTLATAATYLAAGIYAQGARLPAGKRSASGGDHKKSLVFVQSHNSDHTELAWILNTITRIVELERMTQFKDKTQRISQKIYAEIPPDFMRSPDKKGEPYEYINIKFGSHSAGLLNYPVLMAADILLYGTDIVPVGEDQKQHVELTRTLVRRFNQQFGETFKVPEVMVHKEGARIMGLDDPTKKMSKGATSPLNYIALTDAPEVIKDKIKRAVTDSGSEIKYDPENKPAISNLLTIYSLVTDKSIPELEKQYKDCHSYVEFKNVLADVIVKFLTPFQKKFNELIKKPEEIKKILKNGAQEAREISAKTLEETKKKMGLI
ncbi:MAG: tryptophan--tRNA ligase [Candidatus Portnoybacteria bacterium]|nr:tryptophan--tRNA ligase [Candidatus Portnoybacteria bacterium]